MSWYGSQLGSEPSAGQQTFRSQLEVWVGPGQICVLQSELAVWVRSSSIGSELDSAKSAAGLVRLDQGSDPIHLSGSCDVSVGNHFYFY